LDFFSFPKPMKFESSVALTNSNAIEIVVHLEPWGEQFAMSPGITFSITAKAEQPGSFEIEYLEQEIIVWAWPTAIVKVFRGNVEVGIGAGLDRPAVPPVPEGQSVSSFLRGVLGRER
jgi:hypothetical protein